LAYFFKFFFSKRFCFVFNLFVSSNSWPIQKAIIYMRCVWTLFLEIVENGFLRGLTLDGRSTGLTSHANPSTATVTVASRTRKCFEERTLPFDWELWFQLNVALYVFIHTLSLTIKHAHLNTLIHEIDVYLFVCLCGVLSSKHFKLKWKYPRSIQGGKFREKKIDSFVISPIISVLF